MAGKPEQIGRQTSFIQVRHLGKRHTKLKLITVGNGPEPGRAPIDVDQPLAVGQQQLDVQLGGYWKRFGADRAQSAHGEVFRERFHRLGGAAGVETYWVIHPQARIGAPLGMHRDRLTAPPLAVKRITGGKPA